MTDPRAQDRDELAQALAIIRGTVPDGWAAHFIATDQDVHGFILDDVELRDGSTLLESDRDDELGLVRDAMSHLVSDIAWRGVMGEDKQTGKATILLWED